MLKLGFVFVCLWWLYSRRLLAKSYSSKGFFLKKVGLGNSFHLANGKVFRKKEHLYTKCLCFFTNRCLGMVAYVLYILNAFPMWIR